MPSPKAEPAATLKVDQNGASTALLTELTAVTRTLADAVQALNTTMNQLQRSPSLPGFELAPAVPSVQVNTWTDDPFSELLPTPNPQAAAVVTVDFQANVNPLLRTAITALRPEPGLYDPGSPEFLYWCAEEALARGINFWTTFLPASTTWSEIANPIPVDVDAGEELRARYLRGHSLQFFHIPIRDVVVFTGESPDTVLHELGHAILDAVQPNLWEPLFFEVDAFHEAFGDMSAILGSLQMRSMRENVLSDTQGQLNVNSRLSRIAERFGWGFRSRKPMHVEPDCLRNAANIFDYRLPEELQPRGPAHQLTQEPHSMCRIMTGALLDALAAMFTRLGSSSDANLVVVSRDMGQLLIDAVINADYGNPRYFKEIAKAMILSDQVRNGGRYRADLKGVFLKRRILSAEDIVMLDHAPPPVPVEVVQPEGADLAAALGAPMLLTYDESYDAYARGYGETWELPKGSLTTSFGDELVVHMPERARRSEFALAAAFPSNGGSVSGEDETRSFVDSLIKNGRVKCNVSRELAPSLVDLLEDSSSRQTHVIEETANGVELRRIAFDCALGCDG